MGHHEQVHDNQEKQLQGCIVDVIIPINPVCVFFDPAIPTSSFDYIVFYTYFCSFLFLFRVIHQCMPSDMIFPLTHIIIYSIAQRLSRVGYFQTEAAAVNGRLAQNCVYTVAH